MGRRAPQTLHSFMHVWSVVSGEFCRGAGRGGDGTSTREIRRGSCPRSRLPFLGYLCQRFWTLRSAPAARHTNMAGAGVQTALSSIISPFVSPCLLFPNLSEQHKGARL